MENTKFTVSGLLRTGFQLSRKNIEVLLLIAFLYVLATVIILNPFLPFYAALLTVDPNNPQSLGPGLLDGLGIYILLGIVFIPLIYGLFLSAWIRTVLLGREYVLEGGIKKLVERTLWVVVRYLALIGYLILIMLIITLPFTLVFSLIAGFGGLTSDGGALSLFPGALLVAIFIPSIFLTIAFIFSASAASLDQKLGIREGWNLTKGNRAPFFWAVVTIYISYYIALFALGFLLVAGLENATTPEEAMQYIMSPAGIIYYIITSVSGMVVFALVLAMLADAWRQLSQGRTVA